jgi:hypothetical protein
VTHVLQIFATTSDLDGMKVIRTAIYLKVR